MSKAPLEQIEAQNTKGACIIDFATGKVSFSILMKGFEFKKGLMQDHFNENYVESDKFPKATFTGLFQQNPPFILVDGNYDWKVNGIMELHGVSKPFNAIVKATIANGQPTVQCNFSLQISEFGIKIPSIVADKISNQVSIKVSPVTLQKM